MSLQSMPLPRILVTLFLVFSLSPAFADDAGVGLSAVTRVRVLGEASSVALTTRADSPFVGAITHRRHGWIGQLLSLWSYDECATSSNMRLDGATLTVTIASSRLSSCHVVFTANLPEGVAIAIEQPAAEIDLNGVFDQIRLNSIATDIRFTGEAREMTLKSDALKVLLVYAAVHGQETIRLDSKFVAADVRFAKVDAISYRVDADAAMVNSRYPHTQGAKPDIRVTAEKAQISID